MDWSPWACRQFAIFADRNVRCEKRDQKIKALFARPTPLKKVCSRYVPVVGVFVDSIVFGVL